MTEAAPSDVLAGRTVAFLVANLGVEQIELTDPWAAVQRAGGTPRLVAPTADPVQGFNHVEKGDTFPVDLTVEQARVADFAGLVLPGGVRNGDRLRTDAGAVALTRAFFAAGKPVAAICHAHWTMIEADAVRGRRLTSWPSVATDLRNAGADWVDEQVVIDKFGPNTLITSRNPGDLEAFDAAFIAEFARA